MTWQKILAEGFSSSKELLHYLSLSAELGNVAAEQQFKTRVPRGFAMRMQKGNPKDPLLLQVLATQNETEWKEGYVSDPLQETAANPLPGLIHKYQGRVLLTLTGACAIHCRYCFRRHFPYQENNPGRKGWQNVLRYIAEDHSIREVILSGGDPLLASDATLEDFVNNLETIEHVQTLRVHSRIPLVLPERINSSLLKLLANTRLRKVMVLHCNHPQELNNQVHQVCQALREVGCHLLNQTVLLKGINDEALVLAQLNEQLFEFGVLPYYLHLLDKVAGASHFDLPKSTAKNLHRQLQSQLPGYLVPRLVCEEAGKANKTWL